MSGPPEASQWADTAEEINRLHADILSHARQSVENAIRIGEILSHVKESLKHGEWLPWIKANVPFSDQSARNYIRCCDHRDQLKFKNDLNLSDAYALALSNGNGKDPRAARLHTPNFHSQAVRLRQTLVGLFNHYLQRRPLKQWHTEEVYDLLCSLEPLTEVCNTLRSELSTRNDLPRTYGQTHRG